MLLAGGLIQIDGGVAGFFQPRPVRFNVDGRVALCMDRGSFGKPVRARAPARCRTSAPAAARDFGFFGQFSGFFFWKKPAGRPKRFDVGKGCGFQNRVKVQRKARQAGGPLTFPVPANNDQYVAHFRGADGAAEGEDHQPVRARVIQSGPDTDDPDRESFLIIENPTRRDVDLPPARSGGGRLAGRGDAGGSAITTSRFQARGAEPDGPPGQGQEVRRRAVARLRWSAARRRQGHARPRRRGLPADDRGDAVAASACTGGKKAPGKRPAQSLCAQLTWTPKFGFAGARECRRR